MADLLVTDRDIEKMTNAEKTALLKRVIRGDVKISPGSRGTSVSASSVPHKHQYGNYHPYCHCETCKDTKIDAENFP